MFRDGGELDAAALVYDTLQIAILVAVIFFAGAVIQAIEMLSELLMAPGGGAAAGPPEVGFGARIVSIVVMVILAILFYLLHHLERALRTGWRPRRPPPAARPARTAPVRPPPRTPAAARADGPGPRRGPMGSRLGIDVGGTFTDLLLFDDETGRLVLHKTPSTPEDQSIGILAGVRGLLERAGEPAANVSSLLHGTTVSTNVVLEEKGAKVGLLVTADFEQILHLARSQTPGPLAGWMIMRKPDPLADLEHTRGVPERMSARGEVVTPLDEARAREAIGELVDAGRRSGHHLAAARLREPRPRAAARGARGGARARPSGDRRLRPPSPSSASTSAPSSRS